MTICEDDPKGFVVALGCRDDALRESQAFFWKRKNVIVALVVRETMNKKTAKGLT